MQLVGYKQSSFAAQDTGEVISGYNFFLTELRENVTGLSVERVFLSERKLSGYQPHLGDEITLVYNRYGKVDSISVSQLAAAE